MPSYGNLSKNLSSFSAIFTSALRLNYRRHLLHRQIITILLLLILQFYNLYLVIIAQTHMQSNQIPGFFIMILLIFITRSIVIDYAENKNRYLYYQKAYGINVYIYLFAWITYSIISWAIKILVLGTLTILYLKYSGLAAQESFKIFFHTLFAPFLVAFFSFYSYTLFFNAILPYSYFGIRIIGPILMTGISVMSSNMQSYNFDKQLNLMKFIPSVWFIGITNLYNRNPQINISPYLSVIYYQAIISFVLSIIIQIIKIKRFQIRNWIQGLKNKKQNTMLEQNLIKQLNSTKKCLISTKKLSKNHKKIQILKNVTIDIFECQTVLLFGENGSGKSTLLKILASLQTSSKGRIVKINGLKIGACLQQSYLFRQFSVKQNLSFYGKIKGIDKLKQRIDYILQSFELNEFSNKRTSNLSGGNLKKLALAIAFLGENDLIVIEQPTIGVDVVIKRQIWRILTRYKESHPTTSIIIASSDPEQQLLKMANRVFVMINGQINADFSSKQWQNQNRLLTVQVKDCNILNKDIIDWIQKLSSEMKIVSIQQNSNQTITFLLQIKNWSQFQQFLTKFNLIQKIIMAKLSNIKDIINNKVFGFKDYKNNQLLSIQKYFNMIDTIISNKSNYRMIFGCVLIRISQIMPHYIDIASYILMMPIFWFINYFTFSRYVFNGPTWMEGLSKVFPLYCFLLFPHVYLTHVQSKQTKYEEIMLAHGLKRIPYWIVSVAIDTLILYSQFIIMGIITYLFQPKYSSLNHGQILASIFLYTLTTIILIKIYVLFFERSFMTLIFLPYMINIIQILILTAFMSQVLSSNSLFTIINIFFPASAYMNIIISTAPLYFLQFWQKLLFFLAQIILFSFLLWLIPIIKFFYKNMQKSLKQKDIRLINSEDKINEKLRITDKYESMRERDEITIQNLYWQPHSKHTIIKEMYLGIEKGSIFGLLGKNGSGKTTTLRLMASLISRTIGNVYFSDRQITSQNSVIYEEMGYCPQFDYFQPFMTVKRHLKIVLILKSIPSNMHQQLSLNMLGIFSMGKTINTIIQSLSEGQKCKLKIITAILCNPQGKYLLLDEASMGLDESSKSILQILIKRTAKTRNATVVYITHKVSEAEAICDRVGILRRGQFITIATPCQLISQYNRGYTIFLQFKQDIQASKKTLLPKLQSIFKVFQWISEENIVKISVPRLYFNMQQMMMILLSLVSQQCCSYFLLKCQNFDEVFEYLLSKDIGANSSNRQTELRQLSSHL